jgi:ATP-binding cassette subfamily B protein
MSDRNDAYEAQAGTFEHEIDIEKAKNSKKTALRLARYLLRQKWKLLVVIISILASSLFEILSPKVLGAAIKLRTTDFIRCTR